MSRLSTRWVALALAAVACRSAAGGGWQPPFPELPALPEGWQDAGGGAVLGVAVDSATGRAVGHALVRLQVAGDTGRAGRHEAVSGERGGFAVLGVPAGAYLLVVRRIGYRQVARLVTVRAGAADTLRVTLSTAGVHLEQ